MNHSKLTLQPDCDRLMPEYMYQKKRYIMKCYTDKAVSNSTFKNLLLCNSNSVFMILQPLTSTYSRKEMVAILLLQVDSDQLFPFRKRC